MRKKTAVGFLLTTTLLLGVFFWALGQDADEGSWEPLAEAPNFYVRTDYEGRTTLGYSTHWWQRVEPLAGGFHNFRRVNWQVVGYDAESGSRVTVTAAAQSTEKAYASVTYTEDTMRAIHPAAEEHQF
ncbi:hypothetical protein [Hymenobacter sublimis]|uniref:Uncharacterized protein n=1 Tax=Hymenobacter sublimis TaxID=2933777 RepID=A0ABY4JCS2_9BACT|nr:hypothetical protein [Hymenobacter sublimis]UPL50617.1 hypothetical protein MWH26_06865 [Hymenobacter sublimis]